MFFYNQSCKEAPRLKIVASDAQEVVEALGEVPDGECPSLQLTGETFDGIPITGTDHVVIIVK